MKNICRKFLAVLLIASYVIPKPIDVIAASQSQQTISKSLASSNSKKSKIRKQLGLGLGIGLGSLLPIIIGANEIFGKHNFRNLIKKRKQKPKNAKKNEKRTDSLDKEEVIDSEESENHISQRRDPNTKNTERVQNEGETDFSSHGGAGDDKKETSLTGGSGTVSSNGADKAAFEEETGAPTSVLDVNSKEDGTETIGADVGSSDPSSVGKSDAKVSDCVASEDATSESKSAGDKKKATAESSLVVDPAYGWVNAKADPSFLGGGSQGTVQKITWKGKVYARKEVEKGEYHNAILSEYLAYTKLKDIDCEYIVKPYDFYAIDEYNHKVDDINLATKAYVLYEYVDFGKKVKFSKPDSLNFEECFEQSICCHKVGLQIIEAWEKLRDLGLSHGDMNAKNVVVVGTMGSPVVKVYDFGYMHARKGKYTVKDLENMECAGTDLANLMLALGNFISLATNTKFESPHGEYDDSLTCYHLNNCLSVDIPKDKFGDGQNDFIFWQLLVNTHLTNYKMRTGFHKSWLLPITDDYSTRFVSALKHYLITQRACDNDYVLKKCFLGTNGELTDPNLLKWCIEGLNFPSFPQTTTLSTDGDVMIIGDIHGSEESFKALFKRTSDFLSENEQNSIVVLGDMIDSHPAVERNPGQDSSLHVLLYFLYLTKKYPGRVVVLRGNHESIKGGENGSLLEYWSDKMKQLLSSLPLCCTIKHNGKKYFAVHGCISEGLIGDKKLLEDIEGFNLRLYDSRDLAKKSTGLDLVGHQLINFHLASGNPNEHPRHFLDYYITEDQLKTFFHTHGFDGLFRGHNPGYKPIALEIDGVDKKRYAFTIHSGGYYSGYSKHDPRNKHSDPELDPRIAILKTGKNGDDTVTIEYFLNKDRTSDVTYEMTTKGIGCCEDKTPIKVETPSAPTVGLVCANLKKVPNVVEVKSDDKEFMIIGDILGDKKALDLLIPNVEGWLKDKSRMVVFSGNIISGKAEDKENNIYALNYMVSLLHRYGDQVVVVRGVNENNIISDIDKGKSLDDQPLLKQFLSALPLVCEIDHNGKKYLIMNERVPYGSLPDQIESLDKFTRDLSSIDPKDMASAKLENDDISRKWFKSVGMYDTVARCHDRNGKPYSFVFTGSENPVLSPLHAGGFGSGFGASAFPSGGAGRTGFGSGFDGSCSPTSYFDGAIKSHGSSVNIAVLRRLWDKEDNVTVQSLNSGTIVASKIIG